MATTKWPDEVPILSADDMVQGPMRDGNCKCTVAWAGDTFDLLYVSPGVTRKINRALNTSAKELGAHFDLDADCRYPELYSDDLRNSKRLIARIWNRAMAKLGYVVGNPEAKNV